MANLKQDLVAMIQNEKYYADQELQRLSYDTSLPYEEKITQISQLLGRIGLINDKLVLVDQYYQVRQQATPEARTLTKEQVEEAIQKPVAGPVENPIVHNGQSHSE